VKRRLFEELVVSTESRRGRGRLALPASIGVHVAVVGGAILLSAFGTRELVPEVAAHPAPVLLAPTVVQIAPHIPPPRHNELPSRRLPSVSGAPAGQRPAPTFVEPTSLPEPEADPVTADAPGIGGCSSPNCLVGATLGSGASTGDSSGGIGEGQPVGRIVRASVDVAPPIKLRDVAPVYPDLAKRARVEGVVVIECTIDPSGRIAGARVLSGQPLLDAAALDAVQQWVYRPTLLNGSPVSVLMTVRVRFILARS
jgi:protein TonB